MLAFMPCSISEMFIKFIFYLFYLCLLNIPNKVVYKRVNCIDNNSSIARYQVAGMLETSSVQFTIVHLRSSLNFIIDASKFFCSMLIYAKR